MEPGAKVDGGSGSAPPGAMEFERGKLKDEKDPQEPKGCRRRKRRLASWSRRSMWVRRLARPGTLLFGFIAAVESAILAAAAVGFPSDGTWKEHSAGWWVLNVVSVITLVLTALLAWRLGESLSDRREELILQQHCRSLWRYLTDDKKLPPKHLGVHVWSVSDPRVWYLPHWLTNLLLLRDPYADPEGWKRFVPRAPFLERRAVFTNERRVHPPMTFTRDKGVIGRCWHLEREIVVDLEPLNNCRTATEFYSRFNYDERYGLSWNQLSNTRHFCAIWVFPIFSGPVGARQFAGCVSVDVNCKDYAERLGQIAAEKDDTLDSLLWDFVAVIRGDWRTI